MKLKKLIIASTLALTIVPSITTNAFASEMNTENNLYDIYLNEGSGDETHNIEKRALKVQWYYRDVNGKKQKRLWSLSGNEWLTDWMDA